MAARRNRASSQRLTGSLILLHQAEFARHHARVLHDHVHPLQRLDPLGELLHTRITAQIQLPDLDNTGPLRAVLDVLLRLLAFVEAATCHNDFVCVEPDIVASRLLPEPGLSSVHRLWSVWGLRHLNGWK